MNYTQKVKIYFGLFEELVSQQLFRGWPLIRLSFQTLAHHLAKGFTVVLVLIWNLRTCIYGRRFVLQRQHQHLNHQIIYFN